MCVINGWNWIHEWQTNSLQYLFAGIISIHVFFVWIADFCSLVINDTEEIALVKGTLSSLLMNNELSVSKGEFRNNRNEK